MTTTRFVIAICTYRRQGGLQNLLTELARQCLPERAIVLVVDNDSEASAAPIAQNHRSLHGNVKYVRADPRGLVVARNVALEFARQRRAALIFIDDDEVPGDGWFDSFVDANERSPNAVIGGPVRPRFEGSLPDWDPTGSFWIRPEPADGERLFRAVGDGNVLYPRKLVESAVRYDLRYNTSGGQETHLLSRWIRSGGEVLWCAGAAVTEDVPAGRLTLSYAQDRSYFAALSYAWIERELNGWDAPLRLLLRAIGRRCQGLVLKAVGTLTSNPRTRAIGVLRASHGKGLQDGLWRTTYDRYTTHQLDVSDASGSP